jgi:glycosyltransferase involved in cell wall biosynthesis
MLRAFAGMRVICIHHRLGGYSSHHFNEAHGFMHEFARRGKEFTLLVNRQASPPVVSELSAHAVLDDPTFRLEWSFEERSRRFRKMLHKHVDRLLTGDDWVLLTISTQLEAHALTLWLRELPRRKTPWVIVLFVSDRWNRSDHAEYERQIAELRKLEVAISSLPPESSRRMIFCAITDPLAEELSGLLGTKVEVCPIPQRLELDTVAQLPLAPQRSSNPAGPKSHPPRVAILGGTRREKGSYLIPGIIRACRPLVRVEFVVQLTNNTLTAEEAATLGRIAEEPDVSVIREAMPLAEYEATLIGADIALFPYEVIPYRKRISGVFAEAAASGKPVVVTPGTWMAGEIEAGRAAGTISEDLSPDSIARAIASCVAELEPLRQSARAVSTGWKARDLSAFVDFLDAQIALRARSERPRRRSWWQFDGG